MKWSQLSLACRSYLVLTYLVSIPFALLCFHLGGRYSVGWGLLSLTSAFVATINVRLPKISSVISMGDVFTILALTQFGPGPALITYWIDIIAAHLVDVIRRFGMRGLSKIKPYRFAFNIACCAISILSMTGAYDAALQSGL